MKTLFTSALCAILAVAAAGFSCNRSSEGGSDEVRVEMKNHSGSSTEVETVTLGSGDQAIKVPGDGWLIMDESLTSQQVVIDYVRVYERR